MKQCTNCLEYKEETEFTLCKTTIDRLTPMCKGCVSAYNKSYRAANRERIGELNKNYHEANKVKICERTKQWIKDNPERRREQLKANYENHKAAGTLDKYYGNVDIEQNKVRSKLWREINPGRVNAQIAKRRSDTIRATPGWVEFDDIIKLYNEAKKLTEQTGVDYEVDHKIPLKSPVVCGLHCIANLQILTAEANNKKKCKFDADL